MKHFLAFFFCLFSFAVNAEENYCTPEREAVIAALEEEFNNCKLNMSDDAYSTPEMEKAYFDNIDCLKNVAFKLFDTYYTRYNKEAKDVFERYVTVASDYNKNITLQSDIARIHQLSGVYFLQALGGTHYMIRELVKSYIDTTRGECQAYDITERID